MGEPGRERTRAARRVDGVKLLGEHRVGCYAAARPPAFIVVEMRFDRDKIGRKKGGSSMWFEFRCNDPACEARVLIRWDKLSEWVQERADEATAVGHG